VVVGTSKGQLANAQITDASGRILMAAQRQLPAGQTQWQMETGNLPAGIYFLQVRTEDGTTKTIRFAKQ
jgi:hypothetical protein